MGVCGCRREEQDWVLRAEDQRASRHSHRRVSARVISVCLVNARTPLAQPTTHKQASKHAKEGISARTPTCKRTLSHCV
eukprot:542164-Rhodomonas_salina.1